MKIKVRIWHKAYKRYLTEVEIKEYNLQFVSGELQYPTNLVVELFTGFADMDNRRIYANDFVKNNDSEKIGMVEWVAGSWRIRFESKARTFWRRLNTMRLWEYEPGAGATSLTVIGSYHKNEELIDKFLSIDEEFSG